MSDPFEVKSLENRARLCAYFKDLDFNYVKVEFDGVEQDGCNCKVSSYVNDPGHCDTRVLSPNHPKAMREAEEMLMQYVWRDTWIQNDPDLEKGYVEWFMADNTIDIHLDGQEVTLIYSPQEGPENNV